jgi:hypothetical protein
LDLNCPNCCKPVSWSEVRCPNCDAVVTFAARLRRRFRSLTLMACPHCQADVSWEQTSCPKCGKATSVDALFGHTRMVGSRLLLALDARIDDRMRRRLQWLFLLASFLGCGWLLDLASASKTSVALYGLLLVFMTVILLFMAVLIPYRLRWALRERTSPLFKLALVPNFLSGMVLLKFLIARFEDQAMVAAAMIGVFFGAILLLRNFVVMLWVYLFWLFYLAGLGPDHDPQGRQGHNVRNDYR